MRYAKTVAVIAGFGFITLALLSRDFSGFAPGIALGDSLAGGQDPSHRAQMDRVPG